MLRSLPASQATAALQVMVWTRESSQGQRAYILVSHVSCVVRVQVFRRGTPEDRWGREGERTFPTVDAMFSGILRVGQVVALKMVLVIKRYDSLYEHLQYSECTQGDEMFYSPGV